MRASTLDFAGLISAFHGRLPGSVAGSFGPTFQKVGKGTQSA